MKLKLKRKSGNEEGGNWGEGESRYQNDETKRRKQEEPRRKEMRNVEDEKKKRNARICKEIERKRVEIEGGIEEGSWRFRRKKTTFRDKLKNGIRSDAFGGK